MVNIPSPKPTCSFWHAGRANCPGKKPPLHSTPLGTRFATPCSIVVDWGLAHRSLGPISAIGVYEIQYAKGHKYLTLVYQIDSASTRLLWIGQERTVEAFQGFFAMLGTELSSHIQFVCSDMWKPYLRVVRDKGSQALHILDRFHMVAKMNEALAPPPVPLVLPQGQNQSHFATEVPATRSAPLQPANRSCLFAQRRLPALLGLQLFYLGWSVS